MRRYYGIQVNTSNSESLDGSQIEMQRISACIALPGPLFREAPLLEDLSIYYQLELPSGVLLRYKHM